MSVTLVSFSVFTVPFPIRLPALLLSLFLKKKKKKNPERLSVQIFRINNTVFHLYVYTVSVRACVAACVYVCVCVCVCVCVVVVGGGIYTTELVIST